MLVLTIFSELTSPTTRFQRIAEFVQGILAPIGDLGMHGPCANLAC
jgi:hypothetical protein